jgi:nucleotide-binding universal stress UspA family protein
LAQITSSKDSATKGTSGVESSGFKRILVTIDGSEDSKRASSIAIDLCERFASDLVILTVIDGRAYDRNPTETEKKARELIDLQLSIAKKHLPTARGEILRPGESTVEQILSFVDREKVDLIVVGTRGLGGFKKLLLGSVSSGVVSHATCSVLVAR